LISCLNNNTPCAEESFECINFYFTTKFSKSIDKFSANYLKGFADGKRDAQKHGHWKSMEIKNNDMYGYLSPPSRYIHECSKCGNKIENYVKKCNIKYCDTCGAEMDEVTEYYE
jgi:hypothetical protein